MQDDPRRRSGQAPPLWRRHRGLATAISRSYYAPGYEEQDLEQVAWIALWEAARLYDPGKGAFPPFAKVVIRRRLGDLIDHANRKKNRVLNEANRETDVPYEEQPSGQLALIIDALPQLSPLEREALARRLNGQQTSAQKHNGFKEYDNALQRARRKLRAAMAV